MKELIKGSDKKRMDAAREKRKNLFKNPVTVKEATEEKVKEIKEVKKTAKEADNSKKTTKKKSE